MNYWMFSIIVKDKQIFVRAGPYHERKLYNFCNIVKNFIYKKDFVPLAPLEYFENVTLNPAPFCIHCGIFKKIEKACAGACCAIFCDLPDYSQWIKFETASRDYQCIWILIGCYKLSNLRFKLIITIPWEDHRSLKHRKRAIINVKNNDEMCFMRDSSANNFPFCAENVVPLNATGRVKKLLLT